MLACSRLCLPNVRRMTTAKTKPLFMNGDEYIELHHSLKLNNTLTKIASNLLNKKLRQDEVHRRTCAHAARTRDRAR